MRQEDPKFEASLDYIARPCLKKTKTTEKNFKMKFLNQAWWCGSVIPAFVI
jgi:hypothetical protein